MGIKTSKWLFFGKRRLCIVYIQSIHPEEIVIDSVIAVESVRVTEALYADVRQMYGDKAVNELTGCQKF